MENLGIQPTVAQSNFINAIAYVVNAWLNTWGRSSGKSVARQLLVKRILEDDR